MRALTPLFLCAYVVGPLNMALTLMGRQRLQLAWDFGRLLLVAGVWASMWLLETSVLTSLITYSIAASVAYAAYLLVTDRELARMASLGSDGP